MTAEQLKEYKAQHAHERYMKRRASDCCTQCGKQDERTLKGYCRCEKCTVKEKEQRERKMQKNEL